MTHNPTLPVAPARPARKTTGTAPGRPAAAFLNVVCLLGASTARTAALEVSEPRARAGPRGRMHRASAERDGRAQGLVSVAVQGAETGARCARVCCESLRGTEQGSHVQPGARMRRARRGGAACWPWTRRRRRGATAERTSYF
jgi:hypothetical protein